MWTVDSKRERWTIFGFVAKLGTEGMESAYRQLRESWGAMPARIFRDSWE